MALPSELLNVDDRYPAEALRASAVVEKNSRGHGLLHIKQTCAPQEATGHLQYCKAWRGLT